MNCKPGDLAIIIKATHQSNLGRIVKVVADCKIKAFGDWEVEFVGGLPETMKDAFEFWGFSCAFDSWLKPVSGLPLEEETEQKMKEPA